MTTNSQADSKLPYTVVLVQQPGIGDLVWHLPYLRAIAAQSRNSQIGVIASPTTMARQILMAEDCVTDIHDYYHIPRRSQSGLTKLGVFGRMRNLCQSLKSYEYERIVLLSGSTSRGLLAYMSGIHIRQGYGYRFLQRLFLNSPPYIQRYHGNAISIYHEAGAFCVAHGYCDQPIVPRMTIAAQAQQSIAERLAALPRPIYVLAIGSSELHKQWGTDNYRQLAAALATKGFGVVLLGGPAEAEMAKAILQGLSPQAQATTQILTDTSMMESAAATQYADACIGNDTGICQIAAACARPCYIIIGERKPLDHDPLQKFIQAESLHAVTTGKVLSFLDQADAPGFA